MSISKEELIRLYPVLYHVSLAPSLSCIRKYGLLSTSALLDLFEVKGPRRAELESHRRLQSELLLHPVHGRAYLNDQSPLQEGPLSRCLQDMSVAEWIRELNRRVFFFPREKRVERLFNAKLARSRQRIIVAIKTEVLLHFGVDSVELSSINSGNATRKASCRGKNTFKSLDQYPFEERRVRHGLARAIAEVTFLNAVPPGDHFHEIAL